MEINNKLIHRILHLSPTDIRVDSRILKELKALEVLDDCKLHAFGIELNEGIEVKEIKSYIHTTILFTRKLLFLPRPLRYLLNLLEAIIKITPRAIRVKPTIIHCHDTLFLPIALIVKIFCNSKLIYDAHELESDKAGQTKPLQIVTINIEKIAWKKIDLLISVSQSILDWYNTKLGIKSSLLILNSPYFNKSIEKTDYLREKFNIPNQALVYIYVGIISSKGRGVVDFLEIFKKSITDAHVVFLGYGDYTNTIIEYSASYKNIHYHPAVEHSRVVEIAGSADVGLCMIEPISLSDYYSLPNKLFEYAFAGLKVLGSNLPEIKQIIEVYNLGECFDLNKSEILPKIDAFSLEDRQINQKKLYNLSWDYQEQKLINSYKQLLGI